MKFGDSCAVHVALQYVAASVALAVRPSRSLQGVSLRAGLQRYCVAITLKSLISLNFAMKRLL